MSDAGEHLAELIPNRVVRALKATAVCERGEVGIVLSMYRSAARDAPYGCYILFAGKRFDGWVESEVKRFLEVLPVVIDGPEYIFRNAMTLGQDLRIGRFDARLEQASREAGRFPMPEEKFWWPACLRKGSD